MKYCKFCEHQLKDTDLFCNKCGMQQEIPTGRAYSPPTTLPDGYSDYPQYGSGYYDTVPPEIKVWNWGAFFLTFFWAIAMNQWLWVVLAIIGAFIPLGGLAICVICGIMGNEMAWRSRQWDSVGHFMDTQAVWNRWGCGCGLFIIISNILGLISLLDYTQNNSTFPGFK